MKSLRCWALILTVVAAFGISSRAAEADARFHNGGFADHVKWRDDGGNLLNAHDGGILYAHGKYHWYGMALRPMSVKEGGQKTTTGVVMYSSTNLYDWTYEGVILECSTDPKSPLYGPMRFERPKIIYNDRTQTYVMWFHYVQRPGDHTQKMGGGEAGVASCKTVNGKYTFHGTLRPIDDRGIVRDSTLFKDEDGSAYFIYDRDIRIPGPDFGRVLHIVKLSDDYLAPTKAFYKIDAAAGREAPVMLRRDGYYFLITSGLTSWDFNRAKYFRATNIFGPYTDMGDPCVGEHAGTTFDAQGTQAFTVQGKTNEVVFLCERHNTACMTESSFVFLPVFFPTPDTLQLRYLPEWKWESWPAELKGQGTGPARTQAGASGEVETANGAHGGEQVYDARTNGREVLTPKVSAEPRFTGATVFGIRPGKPIRFHVTATGEKPMDYSATGLPLGVTLDPASGWITGRAPQQVGDVVVTLKARNAKGSAVRALTLRVGDTICLTPPMGWNSWYVHSEGVSEKAIREIAAAMQEKGLTDHGWTYLNIDDCWMGLRDPVTKAIQPNAKFGDMKALAEFVNRQGLKLGLYSTPWMCTYAGYIGGSAPNEAGDYSEFFLPEKERQNPQQLFGRYPNGIRKGLAKIGPVWLVDRDARQFADWGIDYVKYDWKEWTLLNGTNGYAADKSKPQYKTEANAKRVHEDFRALDRDIVLSFSPDHDSFEEGFVPNYCNLWRLTGDIQAQWSRLVAPFGLEQRLQLTRPGSYGDLDMLQIGPLGKPNRAEVVFKPSPLKPAEQYLQVTLWCILTQPLLLSCNIPTMDAFDLNLVTNDEVLAVDQDPLCRQGHRVANRKGEWEIWAKDLADGSKAVALFNLSNQDQALSVTKDQLGLSGSVRDLWRQKDIGTLDERLSAMVSPHGVLFVKVKPALH